MSDLNTIFAITALALGNIYVWWFVDRILRDRLDIVVSGIVRGVSTPTEHRQISLWLSYTMRIGGAAAGQLSVMMCWLVAAKNAATDDVKFLCYVGAWIVLLAVVGWILTGIVWHRYLASLLRKAA